MGEVRSTLEDFTMFIKKHINLIPMCFASWFVWLMIDDSFMADMLLVFGWWFVIPLIVWAIIVFLRSFWKKMSSVEDIFGLGMCYHPIDWSIFSLAHKVRHNMQS